MKLAVQHLAHTIGADHPALHDSYIPSDDSTIASALQPRAIAALSHGINISQPGYNLYIAGPNGSSRVAHVKTFLKPLASSRPTPNDWLYVNNFDNALEPRAISLPPKQGSLFVKDMENMVESLLSLFPTVFENPGYLRAKSSLQKLYDQTYEQAMAGVERFAAEHNMAIFKEEGAITFTPLVDGQPMDEAEFAVMSEQQREVFREAVEQAEEMLNERLLELPQWQRELNNKLKELRENIIKQTIKPLFDVLQQKYSSQTGVLLYLAQMVNHLPRFIEENLYDSDNENAKESLSSQRQNLEATFMPNLITRDAARSGAPVLIESNPTYANLFGRINYVASSSGLQTSYRSISPGALHLANGGYLLLDIEKLLREPSTWEALKHCLRDGRIHIDPQVGELQASLPTVLKPESVTLNVKIILIGPPDIYYALQQYDHDFDELFRVLVDMDSEVKVDEQSVYYFAQDVRQRAKDMGLTGLNNGAVAALLDHACRLAEDQNKFSASIDRIMEVVVEANQFVTASYAEHIEAEHISTALEYRATRNARLYELIKESILSDRIKIATAGSAVGRCNGLTVIQVGDSAYGCPVRISATAHPGKHGVLDIEREVNLGQAVHSKGVLLLSGYLCGRYCVDFPLAMSAQIAMEQSYGYVDGDSASVAELCTLLSALTKCELRQDIAITGSINQYGEVQAVGGVNEKIEGFFDICCARGLSGEQGVIIPASNTSDLMLNKHVIAAVAEGKFHIYAVEHADEALALLSGQEPGKESKPGEFPASSLNASVVDTLRAYTRLSKPN
ncbi:MAG TPA: ATP-binding protein [Pseudomonadales bacterium]|nr:ATP-binding protein [Pseudomonadales bacterium]